MKEKDTEQIFSAFLELPEEQQAIIETDFQNINALVCEGGIRALVDESVFFLDDDFVEAISVLDGFHSKVMRALCVCDAICKYSIFYVNTFAIFGDYKILDS